MTFRLPLLTLIAISMTPTLHSMDQETCEQKVYRAWAFKNPDKITKTLETTNQVINIKTDFLDYPNMEISSLKPHNAALYQLVRAHITLHNLDPNESRDLQLTEKTTCKINHRWYGELSLYVFESKCDKSSIKDLTIKEIK